MSPTGAVDLTQTTILMAVATVLTCITTVLVAIRVWIRFFMIKKSGMDDYMAIGALIFTIGYLAVLYQAKTNGMGAPMGTLTVDEMETILKITFAIELLYYAIVGCVKSSIVFMYDRFAVSDTMKNLCLATNSLLLVFFIICIGVVVGQCKPLDKAWELSRFVEGSCIDTTKFFYFTSGFGILIDCWILILPLPTLRLLQISRRTRHVLYGVFGIGILATAFSCARLYSISTYTKAADPFRDSTLVNVWSMVEVNVAIWCASAPALKPIFSPSRLLDSNKSSTLNYHSLNIPSALKNTNGSTSQSHIVYISSDNHSSSPRGSSQGGEDIELERPGTVHIQGASLIKSKNHV
ncbi:hypothetical protein GGR53DRAFT_522373 [Hypoxylon sp. FL1150]|nr:hypothetical protein GGR53DRAFT_522373 [Hypoxylon sp. FL1150]